MSCKIIEAISPTGFVRRIFASATGDLWIDRQTPKSLFIDIRDDGLPKHKDGFDRLAAQVPSSWMIVPKWSEEAEGITEREALRNGWVKSMMGSMPAVKPIPHAGVNAAHREWTDSFTPKGPSV